MTWDEAFAAAFFPASVFAAVYFITLLGKEQLERDEDERE